MILDGEVVLMLVRLRQAPMNICCTDQPEACYQMTTKGSKTTGAF
jgi:hypothetical protein